MAIYFCFIPLYSFEIWTVALIPGMCSVLGWNNCICFKTNSFSIKGIVSICGKERIMASHLVPHPCSFSCTFKHTQTHAPILRRKDGRTRAKLNKHIHFQWLRSWKPSTSYACVGNPLLRPTFLRFSHSVNTANSRLSFNCCSAHTTLLLNFWTLESVSALKEKVECHSFDVQNNPVQYVVVLCLDIESPLYYRYL